jgi:hypothetical protein
MRKPEVEHQLRAYSLKESKEALNQEVLRFRRVEIKVIDGAMSITDLINSIWLWYCQQPEADRDTIVTVGGADYRERLNSDQPLPLVLPDGASSGPEPTRGTGLTPSRGIKSKKRKTDGADLSPADRD